MPQITPTCKNCKRPWSEGQTTCSTCGGLECIWVPVEAEGPYTEEWTKTRKDLRIAYLIGALEYISPYDMMFGVTAARDLMQEYEELTGEKYPGEKELLYCE